MPDVTAILDHAVAEIHRHAGESVEYYPAGSPDVYLLRAVVSRIDPVIQAGTIETTTRAPGWSVRIRRHALPLRPRTGDRVVCATTMVTVRDVAEDAERTEWILDAG